MVSSKRVCEKAEALKSVNLLGTTLKAIDSVPRLQRLTQTYPFLEMKTDPRLSGKPWRGRFLRPVFVRVFGFRLTDEIAGYNALSKVAFCPGASLLARSSMALNTLCRSRLASSQSRHLQTVFCPTVSSVLGVLSSYESSGRPERPDLFRKTQYSIRR